MLHGLFQKFMLLRVLILCPIFSLRKSVIPKEIGNLIHLRYLGLVGWHGTELHSTIENQQNLLTLNLKGVFLGNSLSKIIWKMENLKHLYLPGEYDLLGKGSVMNLDRLQKLKTLWNVKGGEWMLSEMPRLSPCLRKLNISEIKSEEQLKAVLYTPSILSNNLHTLDLTWLSWDNSIQLDGMDNLEKCESLRYLTLRGVIRESRENRSIVFPPKLVDLRLLDAFLKEVDVMGIIDKCCPQLKSLTLEEYAYVGNKLVCSANSFPQLEKLTLVGTDELKQWTIEKGAMSNLMSLLLSTCDNLKLTSDGWRFLSKLPQESQFQTSLWRRRNDHGHPLEIDFFILFMS